MRNVYFRFLFVAKKRYIGLSQGKPKNNNSLWLHETILQPWGYFLSPMVTDGKEGDGLQLEKVGRFLKFSLWTDQVFGPESTLARSFRSRRSSSRVRRGILPIRKDNRELYCEIWSRKQQKHHDITPFSASEPKYNRPSAFSARFLHWRSFAKLFQLSAEILCKRQGHDSACKKN